MGRYVNPSDEAFRSIRRDEYVDKTGIIAAFDSTLDTPRKLACIVRPRRFGKTFAAAALTAYYSCGCSSADLFDGLAVSHAADFAAHLNKLNVIRLDMAELCQAAADDVVDEATRVLLPELRDLVPAAGMRDAGRGNELTSTIYDVVQATGRKFVFVIDEWDAPYRLSCSTTAQDRYADWLRALFKGGSFTADAIAGAYITGILPIKKYNHQSAVSDFWEYTMFDAANYAPYVGFTTEEVADLCARYSMDALELRRWYDGYDLRGVGHVYAPFSVMQACRRGACGSYWASSETYEGLRTYLDMDFDGLRGDVVRLLGGDDVPVNPRTFQNDMSDVQNRDDVLTLLVHLGYLAYDSENRSARIPNDEIREELRNAMGESRHAEVARIVRESDRLLCATWAQYGSGNGD